MNFLRYQNPVQACIEVRFMSLTGKFATVATKTFTDSRLALDAVKAYAEANGFTNVKEIDGEEPDNIRYTATTPSGRGGRNVAFGDWIEGKATRELEN